MAVNHRYDLNSLLLMAWIIFFVGLLTASYIYSPYIRRFIGKQLMIESLDPQQTKLIATANHSEVVR